MAQNSRGPAISAYNAAFSKGAKVYGSNIQSGTITSGLVGTDGIHNANISAKSITSAKIRAAFLSGTLVSGQTTRAIAHGLGVKPKFVVVEALLTLAQGISAKIPQVNLAAASAATTTNFYVIGNQAANAALKYVAYVQL